MSVFLEDRLHQRGGIWVYLVAPVRALAIPQRNLAEDLPLGRKVHHAAQYIFA